MSDEISKIKNDIEKSGLPLEIEVRSLLVKKGWAVSHQAYYLDLDEKKSTPMSRWKYLKPESEGTNAAITS